MRDDAEIHLHRVTAADHALVREVRLRALREDPDAFGSTFEHEKDRTPEEWAAFAGREHAATFLALAAGRPVGIAGGSPYRQIYWNFAWSGDSRSIVFKAMRSDKQTEIAMIDARGASYGLTTLLKDNPLPALAWSPDAKQILISLLSPDRQNHQQLFSLKPEAGTEPAVLPGLDPKVDYLDAAFSPDGKQLLFSGR